MPNVDLSYAIGLPPEKAIEYFKSKGYKLTWNWHDLWQEAHAKAFTVAKVMKMDILRDIREMVQKAIEQGIGFQQFKKELEPRLKSKGWWGYKLVTTPEGKVERILEGAPWRLKTIYNTNLQSAYMAGRYKAMMENVDDRPYWQYVAVLDRRTRPAHRALNGKVFRYDDPFWQTHYPPNGFNCRCRVRALSARDIAQRGLRPETSEGRITYEDQLISKKTGELKPVAVYTDPATGAKIPTEPGWSYNPGKAAFVPDLSKYPPEIAELYFRGHQPFSHIKDEKLRDYIRADLERAYPEARLLIEKYQYWGHYKESSRGSFCTADGTLIGLDFRQTKMASGVFIHEFGHRLESLAKLHLSSEFKAAFFEAAQELKTVSIPLIQDPTAKYHGHLSVSDLFSALTEGRIKGRYSHDIEYWQSQENRLSEAFADLFEIWATDKTAWEEMVEKYLPALSQAFRNILSRL